MVGHMSCSHRMAGGTGGGDCGFARHFARCGMGADGGFLCGADRDFASRPRFSSLDCLSRSIVRTALFKKRQHMLGTSRSPNRQKPVLGKLKRPAAMDCYKTPVAH